MKTNLNQIKVNFPNGQYPQEPLDITLVIPLLDEGENLRPLYQKIKNVLSSLNKKAEILFIDDGSNDNSWMILTELANQDHRIKLIRNRRNFGKATAIASGFTFATGDIVITLDADLQDEPAEIPKLIQKIEEGYDVVVGWKKNRKDPITKTFPSKIFNFMESRISRVKLHDINSGLKAYRWNVARNLINHSYGEMHRFYPVLAANKGYIVTEVPVDHHPRIHGKSKYGFNRFYRGFLDLFTVLFISRYYGRPLHLFGMFGAVNFSLGMIIFTYLTILKLFYNEAIGSRPLLMLGVILIIAGMQIGLTGLIAEMIRSFQSNKNDDYTISQVFRVDRRLSGGLPDNKISVERRNSQLLQTQERSTQREA